MDLKQYRRYTVNRMRPEHAYMEIPKPRVILPPSVKYRGKLAKNYLPFEKLRGHVNMKSVFSDKLDPSVHGHRIKRQLIGTPELKRPYKEERQKQKRIIDEAQMEAFRKKNLALEARDIQDLARQVSLKVLETMIGILDNPDASDTAKIAASHLLLDRAYGKAAITNFNVNASADAKPSELDAGSLDKRIAEALNRVEKLTVGATEEGESQERPADIRKYN